MKFYSVTNKYSYGYSKPRVVAVDSDCNIKDRLEIISKDYNWSDQFRGFKYKLLRKDSQLVQEYIKSKIRELKSELKYIRYSIKYLENLVKG